MVGYYSVFNLQTLQFGMTPNSTSTKVAITQILSAGSNGNVGGTGGNGNPTRNAELTSNDSYWIAGGTVVSAAASYFIW